MNDVTKLANHVYNHINIAMPELQPKMVVAPTGSIYIKLSGKVRQVRVADHNGRKTTRMCWELRTDVMTTRNNGTRIYNHRAINQLLKDII